MNDYDTSIVVFSAMKFKSKKNGTDMTRIEVLLTDPTLTGANDKFVGCVPCTLWYNGIDAFDKIIDNGLILKGATGHFVTKKDFKDPTKTTSKLESITYKDNVITLLQSNE